MSRGGNLSSIFRLLIYEIYANSLSLHVARVTYRCSLVFFRRVCWASWNPWRRLICERRRWLQLSRCGRAWRNSKWVIFWRWRPGRCRGNWSRRRCGSRWCCTCDRNAVCIWRAVPEVLVHEFNEEEVELWGVALEGRHEVGEYAECQHRLVYDLEHAHALYVFEAGVDGHVEVVGVLHLILF